MPPAAKRRQDARPVRRDGRLRLLEAAREVFAERGYVRTSTREVAERAGVTEPMVYRHFGTKAALFEEAAVEPFRAYVQQYWSEWESRTPTEQFPPAIEEAARFVGGLYDIFAAQRRLLIAMIAVDEFDETMAGQKNPLEEAGHQVLDRLAVILTREAEFRGYPDFEGTVIARLVVGMTFAMAVHGNWLDPDGQLSRDRVCREIATLVVAGVAHRADVENSGSPTSAEQPVTRRRKAKSARKA